MSSAAASYSPSWDSASGLLHISFWVSSVILNLNSTTTAYTNEYYDVASAVGRLVVSAYQTPTTLFTTILLFRQTCIRPSKSSSAESLLNAQESIEVIRVLFAIALEHKVKSTLSLADKLRICDSTSLSGFLELRESFLARITFPTRDEQLECLLFLNSWDFGVPTDRLTTQDAVQQFLRAALANSHVPLHALPLSSTMTPSPPSTSSILVELFTPPAPVLAEPLFADAEWNPAKDPIFESGRAARVANIAPGANSYAPPSPLHDFLTLSPPVFTNPWVEWNPANDPIFLSNGTARVAYAAPGAGCTPLPSFATFTLDAELDVAEWNPAADPVFASTRASGCAYGAPGSGQTKPKIGFESNWAWSPAVWPSTDVVDEALVVHQPKPRSPIRIDMMMWQFSDSSDGDSSESGSWSSSEFSEA